MRRSLPVGINMPAQPTPVVVGAVPTRASSRSHGFAGLKGILTMGNLANVIPVQHPIIPLKSKAFPKLQGSDTIPDVIRVTQMVAMNLFSPSFHSKAPNLLNVIPATSPDPTAAGYAMPKKQQRGTGGHYTLASPPAIPQFPTFIDRLPR